MATRINKYLSEVGFCSRRVADRLIEEGKVTINGKVPEIGTKVEEGDLVEVEGQKIEKSARNIPNVEVITVREINPINLLKPQKVAATSEALKQIEDWING